MKKPTKPLPEIRRASKIQVAELLGVAQTTVDHWVRQGMPVVERNGRGKAWVFDLLAVLRWKFEPRTVSVTDPEKLTPADRKHWYDGEHKRRTLAEMDAGLIPAPEVEEATTAMHALVADALHRLPAALTQRARLNTEQTGMVEQALQEALADFTDRIGDYAPGLTKP